MDWRKITLGHCFSSVVINNLDVKGVIVAPHKAHTPLIVHTNAMLPLSIMGQRFEPVARRYTQSIKDRGGVELLKLACSYSLNILRQFEGKLAAKNFLGFLVLTRI